MADASGFLKYERELPPRRPVDVRIMDWKDVYLSRQNGEDEVFPVAAVRKQAARCMDCGIPFCHHACPVANLIPEWNDLARRDDWHEAIERLHSTNNFPEFTGKLCPAPCEGSCVLNLQESPVTIKQIEWEIIDRAFLEGWVQPQTPVKRTGKKVAVVGSGPAGLAAAQQLTRAGHDVTVYERADRIGGLLRYGIPEFKMEKRYLDRRLDLLKAEGVIFRPGVNVGVDVPASRILGDFDATLLAGGAEQPRDLPVPGRELQGIHFAMEYLTLQNRRNEGDTIDDAAFISAAGKHVVIIGGGDTGADCLGTAHRQGALAVHQLELLPRPPEERGSDNPWPEWPQIFRVSSAHEEGGERLYSVSTQKFIGENGRVTALQAVQIEAVRRDGRMHFNAVPGSEFEIKADLVLLAMGFVGAEKNRLLGDLGVSMTERGTVGRGDTWMTNVPGVFAAGDIQRGQSLIVWAIAEGRSAARAIDAYLMGDSKLPAPVS